MRATLSLLSGPALAGSMSQVILGVGLVWLHGGGHSLRAKDSTSAGRSHCILTSKLLWEVSGRGTASVGKSGRGYMDPHLLLQAYSLRLWAMRMWTGVQPARAYSWAVGEDLQQPRTLRRPARSTFWRRHRRAPSLCPRYQSSAPQVRIGMMHPR